MKKTFKLMMMALVAIVMSVGFAACSSSDDDDNNTPEQPEQPKTYGFTNLRLEFSDDLLAIANVSLTYTAEDGTTKTEAVTTTKISKDITYTKETTDAMYAIKITLKENYEEKDLYHIVIDNTGTSSSVILVDATVRTDGNYRMENIKKLLKDWEDIYSCKQPSL